VPGFKLVRKPSLSRNHRLRKTIRHSGKTYAISLQLQTSASDGVRRTGSSTDFFRTIAA
jgi:hypothetical protein